MLCAVSSDLLAQLLCTGGGISSTTVCTALPLASVCAGSALSRASVSALSGGGRTKKSRECHALRELRPGSRQPHYWSKPADPRWYDRDVELVDPLADISSYILEQTPRHLVPHVPSLSPLPRSMPVHVSSRAGLPVAARLFPISAQAPPPVAGAAGVDALSVVDEDADWAEMQREIAAEVLGGAPLDGGVDEEVDDADWGVVAAGVADSVSEAVSYQFAEHVRASALSDLLGERAGGAGPAGAGADTGVGTVGGKRAAGAALVGVDRLVFSRLKPTFCPGRAGGGGGE